MRILSNPCLSVLLILIMIATHVQANNMLEYRKARIDSILIMHQWTLVEITQNKDDTLTNMTLLMMPCEKDNFLVFSNNGTYQIMEGTTKCNISDDNIKGKGTWEYDSQDMALIERYGSGSKIAKKILAISDEILRIQYLGEGKRIFTLTYFSEQGKRNDQNKDFAIDNSDPSQNIVNAIKEYLLSTNHYTLIGKKEFDSSRPPLVGDRDTVIPTVTIIPFIDQKSIVKRKERNEELIAQAKKSGVDYVITGFLYEAGVGRNSNGFEGLVKFQVDILDIARNQESSRILNNREVSDVKDDNTKKKKGILRRVVDIAVEVVRSVPIIFSKQLLAYDNLYKYYFWSNVATGSAKTASQVSNVFSQVNEQKRKRNYDSTIALTKAVAEATNDLQEFIAEKTALKIRINRIDGSGNKAIVVIEAGDNVRLTENEILKVVKIKTTQVGGTTIVETEELGEMKVTKIAADILAYCSIVAGRSKITEAYNKLRAEIFAITTIQSDGNK
jgi:hypothetical protein